MKVFHNKKSNAITTVVIAIMIFLGTVTIIVYASDDTTVSIDPSSQIVSPGETFTVDVYCVPGQPIKSFELKLSFDASLLQANSVSEGDIFDGYSTFFNSGTIDNNAGTIVDVFGLIIGSGNVSGSGTFVTISFTATSALGTSTLNLYDVGVTNETGYVSITVNDGSVTVQGTNNPPNTPSTPSGPSTRDVGESGTYSTSATDPDGDQVQYRFDWDASGGHDYSGWTSLGASGHTGSLSHSWGSAGTYVVMAQARDSQGATSGWSNGWTVVVSETNNPPNTPSNPDPLDGATNVDINTDLSWTGGDPDLGDIVTYDVYFEAYDSTPDILVSNDQSGTSYDPGTLGSNTHYYWQIVAKDNHGATTSGLVWDFTTGSQTNNPPNTPGTPSGPSTRDVGESGTYSTSATDPDGDQVQYRFDWDASGGHDYSGWTSLGASGHTGSLSHSWGSAGTYVVMAQARDEHGASSSWSSGLTIVVSEAPSPPSPPPNSPPGSDPPPPEYPPENNPPEQPSVPSGPTFVEIGVEYMFTGSTVDVDGDQIRYRFDWGDSNYSSWSDLVNSNISVSMSHNWSLVSTYEVRVIAQDENGSNSSWSPPLNVTVSQVDSGELPVVDAGGPYNISANQTVSFDASNSYVPDGVIVSYEWDFGDGENGSGINPTHVYQYPGEYTVTLVITDSNGDAYSTSILVTVDSEVVEQQAEEKDILPFYFGYIFIGVALVVLVCLVFFFRMTIKSFVSTYIASLFSQWKLRDMRDRIAKINNRIRLIGKKKVTKTDFKLPPVGIEDTYPDKIQNRDDGICKFVDYGISSTSEEKKSFDEFDGLQAGENVDKLIRMELQPDMPPTVSVSDIDMGTRIDRLILSGGRKSLHKFDSDSVFSEFGTEVLKERLTILFFQRPGKRSTLCSPTIDAWKQSS